MDSAAADSGPAATTRAVVLPVPAEPSVPASASAVDEPFDEDEAPSKAVAEDADDGGESMQE